MSAELTKAERAILGAIEAKGYVIVPRKPTEAMLNAGDEETWEPESDRPYIGTWKLERAWTAMIDRFITDVKGES